MIVFCSNLGEIFSGGSAYKIKPGLMSHKPLLQRGHGIAKWLRRYATNRKITGWRPDEVKNFLNLPNRFGLTGPWCLFSSNRKECQKQKHVSGE
jgi:hypothetical protein